MRHYTPKQPRLLKDQRGQTATEYMLLIGVIIIAVVAAAYTFVPQFKSGINELTWDIETALDKQKIGNVGVGADLSTSGGSDGDRQGGESLPTVGGPDDDL